MAAAARRLPETIFNNSLYTKILSLWFDGLPATATAPNEATAQKWFGMGHPDQKKSFDTACNTVCIDALKALGPEEWPLPPFESFDKDRQAAGHLSAPLTSAIKYASSHDSTTLDNFDVALSLALLLDQMPRNVFRDMAGQKQVYTHYDRLSRALTYNMIHGPGSGGTAPEALVVKDLDLIPKWQLFPCRRMWFYMALMHSEDIADHDAFSSRVQGLRDSVDRAGDKEGKAYAELALKSEKQHRDLIEKFGRYPHRNRPLGRQPTKEEEEYLADGGDTFGTG